MSAVSELLDITTPDGVPLGYSLPRAQVHREGQWHRTVHLWLYNSRGELLLQKRHPSKRNNPDRWDVSSAGHISAGDSPEVSVVREAFEELGVMMHTREITFLFEKQQSTIVPEIDYCDNEIAMVYAARSDESIDNMRLQESEVTEVQWIGVDDFLKVCDGDDFVPHAEEYRRIAAYVKERVGNV